MKISLPPQGFPLVFVIFEMFIPFLSIVILYFLFYVLVGLRRLVGFDRIVVLAAVLVVIRTFYLQIFDILPTSHLLPIVITPGIERYGDRLLVGGQVYKGSPIVVGNEQAVFFFSVGWNLFAAVVLFLLAKSYLKLPARQLFWFWLLATLSVSLWVTSPLT